MPTRRKKDPQSAEAGTRGNRGSAKSRSAASAVQTARQETALDLRDFSQTFFGYFGAPTVPVPPDSPHGPLHVDLSGELATWFGQVDMTLAFQSVEAGGGQQLVAHGSKAFDRMTGWLDRYSAMSVRRLPIEHAGSEVLLQAIKPRNAGISSLKLNDSREPIYVLYWRITYRADDKREEIFVVALDAAGNLLAMGEPDAKRQPRSDHRHDMRWLAQALKASQPIAQDELPSTESVGGEPGISETVSGEPVKSEPVKSDPTPNRLKLPPVTQQVRIAEQARKYATWHADTRCLRHEAEILPRLYKVANRLDTYYQQQMEELSASQDPGGARRDALEQDLQRKIAEEVENHRLRVHLELCGYLLLYTPVATADIEISDGRRKAALQVCLDRFGGALKRPSCNACAREMQDVALCRNGHLCCDECLRQCEGCGDVLCADCGVAACPCCGKQNCNQCGHPCQACGERACIDHLQRCPTCGDEVCLNCQVACAECGVMQCRSHLRADAVVRQGESTRLICTACAVRCPGCKQYSTRMQTCALSGQRFCENCVVTCIKCHRHVGPGFYGRLKSGRPVCRECTQLCAGCNRPANEIAHCKHCGEECCESCSGKCMVCGERFCPQHTEHVAACGHTLCVEHALVCHVGHEAVCPICSVTCAICDEAYCSHHQLPCAICGKFYCSTCVDSDTTVCKTCGELGMNAPEVELAGEPCASLPEIQPLLHVRTWRRSQNRDLTVYLGHVSNLPVIILVRAKPKGGTYVTSRRLTLTENQLLIRYRFQKVRKEL